MPRGYPGSTPGVDPRSQGVIPRRFKQKKNFVTDARMHGRTNPWTDRRVGRNSYLDCSFSFSSKMTFSISQLDVTNFKN